MKKNHLKPIRVDWLAGSGWSCAHGKDLPFAEFCDTMPYPTSGKLRQPGAGIGTPECVGEHRLTHAEGTA